ncbi:MAG: hypothetical protein A3C93_03955 [Candidatus Lloydbacteria bacterium RIFCSPHIGHO2_02_FULL_54_17]|uniref:Uncharacterized protein n=1 Tax=Candidatus Lloydbacteria bacterium RIFCSPHIGHO2_02_FULL_54_17 TaxID=1798664 RepID=A0A1G2DFB9_9BACT|nr:MAG: hypothetical protein A2762_03460 [Candidatus Lloydbacteria bacterium RIFCSPHIGHO2_01_FULL_54_11]OGZ12266.1 MAG: hypothetical protein A3C93_03955 [Candidatus Lloydbacteria bacterium RIFCSPHIGHO2_02_FULL_54_17]OGZ13969.1 MAG: hypothetical protein A2948_00605 [Candidatus Lloydbacteria bacterium RIFCSPLOWO2_01_FULL_54_18]OGZ16426.1 MAG: hypothetical protein A3H76_05375 [Candidatus Lloydbacteria bacterium RIFCSPLOWO2_02_FULL_54_12]
MATRSPATLKLEFTRTGDHKPVKVKLECELAAPKPNPEHATLAHIAPLKFVWDDVLYYPTFQRFKESNTLYRNIATCILCFRASDPKISDFDIMAWFITPNEFLDRETPLKVGRHPDKEVRNRIIEAAEQNAPLGLTR